MRIVLRAKKTKQRNQERGILNFSHQKIDQTRGKGKSNSTARDYDQISFEMKVPQEQLMSERTTNHAALQESPPSMGRFRSPQLPRHLMHTPKMLLENKIAIFEEEALQTKHKRMEERKCIAPT